MNVTTLQALVKRLAPDHVFENKTSTYIAFTWSEPANTWTVSGSLSNYGNSVESITVHDHDSDIHVVLRDTGLNSLTAILRAIGAISVN